MFAGGTGNGQNIVERHRHIGDDDLPGGLGKGLAPGATGYFTIGIEVRGAHRFQRFHALFAGFSQLAPHLPAHPEQQDAADQQQPKNVQKLGGYAGKQDAQCGGGDDADEDRLVALLARQARRREADDDGIVTGQHQVDHHHLPKGNQRRAGKH